MSRVAKGADCNSAGIMPSQVRVLPGPLPRPRSSGVERILGKNEVMGSIPIVGSVPRLFIKVGGVFLMKESFPLVE